jgi:hypothetical protein
MNPTRLLLALLRRCLFSYIDEPGGGGAAPSPAPAAPAPSPAAPAPSPAAPAPSAPAPSPAPAAPAPSPAPAAPAPAPTAAPEKYELKLADGSPLDPSDVDKVAAYARERGLSNEQAQAILDQRHEAATGITERQLEAFAAKRTEWETQTWADPELGGTNKDATLANVQLVMDKFAPGADHELRKELAATGYGNHPAFVRFVNAIGKAMREDKPVGGNGPGAGQRSAADILYGNS